MTVMNQVWVSTYIIQSWMLTIVRNVSFHRCDWIECWPSWLVLARCDPKQQCAHQSGGQCPSAAGHWDAQVQVGLCDPPQCRHCQMLVSLYWPCMCVHVRVCVWERERERERERETERQRDRETERQRDRETERQRDIETERQIDRETERQRDRESVCVCVDTTLCNNTLLSHEAKLEFNKSSK